MWYVYMGLLQKTKLLWKMKVGNIIILFFPKTELWIEFSQASGHNISFNPLFLYLWPASSTRDIQTTQSIECGPVEKDDS